MRRRSVLPVMFRVSAAWRRAKETDPTSLDRPLRCSLLISLILEKLVARLERLQSDEALQKQAQELHWLTTDLKWQYRVWNPAAGGGTGALEVDTSRTPLAQEAVLEHLAQAQKLALEASNLTRFQATRPLAEDMTGSHVAFLLDVGLRGRAAPLHKILTTLVVDCECLSLISGGDIAARLRPQRLRRPPAADGLSKLLLAVAVSDASPRDSSLVKYA